MKMLNGENGLMRNVMAKKNTLIRILVFYLYLKGSLIFRTKSVYLNEASSRHFFRSSSVYSLHETFSFQPPFKSPSWKRYISKNETMKILLFYSEIKTWWLDVLFNYVSVDSDTPLDISLERVPPEYIDIKHNQKNYYYNFHIN